MQLHRCTANIARNIAPATVSPVLRAALSLALLGIPSVLQAASFGRAKDNKATSTREMDPWTTTRDRSLPGLNSFNPRLWNDKSHKTRARVAVRAAQNQRTGQE